MNITEGWTLACSIEYNLGMPILQNEIAPDFPPTASTEKLEELSSYPEQLSEDDSSRGDQAITRDDSNAVR